MTDRRPVLASATILFGVMVAHALLETARDALFLARLGPDRLAWAYLAMAGCALFSVAVVRRWGGVREPRRVLLAFLGFAAVGTGVLAATVSLAPSAVFVLYVWTGVVATLVVPAFWTLIDRSLRVSEAKRVFGAIGAGGVLGAMVGSALAGVLGHWLGAQRLVTAGAIAFVAAMIVAAWLAPRRSLDEVVPIRRKVESVSRASRRYVKLVVAVGLVATVTLTLGDLLFKRVLAERFAAHDLATVFGTIYTVLNIFGLVIQLAVTPALLAHWGVGAALIVLPMLLVATATGFALSGALFAIVALKIADGSLRHSLQRAGSEILFLPLPAALRDRWKPAADALSQRAGQALAALATFALGSLAVGPQLTAAVVGGLAVVWILLLGLVRGAYVAQFRAVLSAGEIERDVRIPDLDAKAVALLSESLANPDEIEALAALDLLARRAQIPALVLYHPREAVVRRALSLLVGDVRPDVARVLAHLIEHSDPKIRAAALAAASRTGSHRDLLERAVLDPDPDVRAIALICLADDQHVRIVSDGLAALLDGSEADRVALARAIGCAPHARFRSMLYELMATREPPVMREVLHVLARVPELADLDRILELLEDPHVRGEARRVFVAAGRRGLAKLIAALDDPRTALSVRRHIPRTISRFRSPAAASALVSRLPREPDGTTEFKILRALGRIRDDDPAIPIDAAIVRTYAERSLDDAAHYTVLRDRLDAERAPLSSGGQLIRELLGEKRRWAIEHAFRAFGVLHPRAGLRSVHDALTGNDDARRSAAREIVETLMPVELRDTLFAVLDDLTPAQRRARLGDRAPGPFPTYESLLAAILADPSDSLKCVVAHEIAERNLVGLRNDLTRLRPDMGPPLVVYAFDQALERLHP
jgi:ATP/ADP translocase